MLFFEPGDEAIQRIGDGHVDLNQRRVDADIGVAPVGFVRGFGSAGFAFRDRDFGIIIGDRERRTGQRTKHR